MHNNKVIEDMMDEDLLSEEIAAEQYARNLSLWSNESRALYLKHRSHWRCSVSQARLSKWTWLIGSPNSSIEPLMCVTPRRDNCSVNHDYRFFSEDTLATISSVVILVHCLFALANLISLAVWFRRKAPIQGSPELRIQLLLLRIFCVLGLVYSLSSAVSVLWLKQSAVRVASVLHAVLLIHIINFASWMHFLSPCLSFSFYFLTSIFLVEYSHPAQTVLLFVNRRRTLILFVATSSILLVLTCYHYLENGFVYCDYKDYAYLTGDVYPRMNPWRVHWCNVIIFIVLFILSAIGIVLLIVYGCKQCCACCRGGPSEQTATDSVAYSRQLDEPDNNEVREDGGADTEGTEVVIQSLPPAVTQCSQLIVELRRLIVCRQVAPLLLTGLLVVYVAVATLLPILKVNSISAIWIPWTCSHQAFIFSSVAVLSPIASPTFRAGFLDMFIELGKSIRKSICWRKLCP